MASDFPSLRRSLEWVERYAKASSGKPNEAKYEGLRMGSLRKKAPPNDFKHFKWLKTKDYATILGVPLGDQKATNTFWRKLRDFSF